MDQVEGIISEPLKNVLEDERTWFNTKYEKARQIYPSLTKEVVFREIRDLLSPIAGSVILTDPQNVGPIVKNLFESSLHLLHLGLIGSQPRCPLVGEGLRRLLPNASKLLLEQGSPVVRHITNAIFNLSKHSQSSAEKWIQIMNPLMSLLPDTRTLAETGFIAAWRSGLAHYRKEALSICRRLDPSLVASCLGVSDNDSEKLKTILDRMEENPWLCPEDWATSNTALKIVRVSGGFRGFGGPFLLPPQVMELNGGLYARSQGRLWRIHADCFGSTLLPVNNELDNPKERWSQTFVIGKDGSVRNGSLIQIFPEFMGSSGYASNAHTLAVSHPHSHYIFLVAVAPDKQDLGSK